MRRIVLSGEGIVLGSGSLEYLKQEICQKAFIVTGGSSMIKSGVIQRAESYLREGGAQVKVYSGIGKNPTFQEVEKGLGVMRQEKPDLVVAVGGGSAMDAAKAMVLFYEFPHLNFENVAKENQAGRIPKKREKTRMICVPSTSGTGSEVTRGTVITDLEEERKVPIMTDCLRPDIAILDGDITMTMPAHIAAETGMDALTHAIEAYTNHNLDDFDEALCRGAIEGIMKYLSQSCLEKSAVAREKVHDFQAMAGIGFANVGLGMVHGIAHSFGAIYNLAHGATNAVILPFVLDYNRQDPEVAAKLKELSYHCRCQDIVEEIKAMKLELGIPHCFSEMGISEQDFQKNFELLLSHSMEGATKVNPVKVSLEDMKYMLRLVYYGIGEKLQSR